MADSPRDRSSKGASSSGGPPRKGGSGKGGSGKGAPGEGRSVRRRKQAARKYRPDPAPPPGPLPEAGEAVRLNRFLAQAGVAARRAADVLISEGRVTVNGTVVTEMGTRVGPADRVEMDGHPVAPKHLVYVLLNKPRDTITTTDDERGRRTVLDLLDVPPEIKDGLYPVGRLDRDTTGALLLTNDGDLAHRLMHPRYGADKLYLCETAESVRPDQLDALRRGVELDDGPARADEAMYPSETRSLVALKLHEGRNRQVRRMFEALGHEVVALDRVGYAGLGLDGLRRGRWRRLQPFEVNVLRRRVKLKALVF